VRMPFFKWYPADAESDERYASMTDSELGFFHRCLNKSWTNNGLPADLDELARLMKVKRSYLDRIWPRVGQCFTPSESDPSRMVNPRQEQERAHAILKSERATESVRTRYERRPNVSIRASESESISESVSESQKTEPLLLKGISPEVWDEFRTSYESSGKPLNEGDWDKACMEAVSQGLTDADIRDRVIPCLKAERLDWAEREVKMVPFPANWLKGRPWTRQGKPRPAPLTPEQRRQAAIDASWAGVGVGNGTR